ncbi:helix-turn-helix domain-containing protein [Mesorhizobium sp. Cs1299R1N3]|uniref:helix-turn-helix domain-containing protein n=1 Tax=Mesorhizobium sp. Cs1299R1N3 TaxID=3015173 RepID=UPI00301BDF4E
MIKTKPTAASKPRPPAKTVKALPAPAKAKTKAKAAPKAEIAAEVARVAAMSPDEVVKASKANKAKARSVSKMTPAAMKAAVANLPPTKSSAAEIEARRKARMDAPPKPKPEPKPVEAKVPGEAKDTPRTHHEFTSANLVAWRDKLGISQREAAKALGIARQSYSNYEAGSVTIPKVVALACQALAKS